MILEQETFDAFGYSPSMLSHGSGKQILVACDDCGKVRTVFKYSYRPLCKSCAFKGDRKPKIKCICLYCKKEFELLPHRIKSGGGKYCSRECAFIAHKGKGSLKYIERNKRICPYCGIAFEVEQYEIRNGGKKYCSQECYGKSLIGREASNKLSTEERKSRRRLTKSKIKAKRKQMGYTLLLPLLDGEVGHHVTDEYVVGIPKDVHQMFGGYSRNRHRALVLEWLKNNDKKKYEIVVSVLTTTLIH